MVKGKDHDIDDSNASEIEEDAYTQKSFFWKNKRARKPPVWLQDYVR